MTRAASARLPRARTEGLLIQDLPDEVLVYDRERKTAHCLNHTAALVWRSCDGQTRVSEIAKRLALDEKTDGSGDEMVWHALRQLSRDHLLEEPPSSRRGMTRRQLARTVGAAAAAAIPL